MLLLSTGYPIQNTSNSRQKHSLEHLFHKTAPSGCFYKITLLFQENTIESLRHIVLYYSYFIAFSLLTCQLLWRSEISWSFIARFLFLHFSHMEAKNFMHCTDQTWDLLEPSWKRVIPQKVTELGNAHFSNLENVTISYYHRSLDVTVRNYHCKKVVQSLVFMANAKKISKNTLVGK